MSKGNCGLLAAWLIAAPAVADGVLSEQEAVELLVGKVTGDSLYADWTSLECLDFFVEDSDDSHVDVAIRERHAGAWPGDPDTAPLVDRFRVLRSSQTVLWYEATENDYVAYENGKAQRKP